MLLKLTVYNFFLIFYFRQDHCQFQKEMKKIHPKSDPFSQKLLKNNTEEDEKKV